MTNTLPRRALSALSSRPPLRTIRETRDRRAYEAAIRRAIADTDLCTALVANGDFPDGWGVGGPERFVEFPWLAAKLRAQRGELVLDAGSTLNHDFVLDGVLPSVEALHVVTLAPEPRSFTDRGVSYLYADLRDLPLRSDTYDTVVCSSTLEHVGMDVTGWGGSTEVSSEPQREALRVVAELRRVAKPTGRVIITVPFGQPDNLGWLRQFDPKSLYGVVTALMPAQTTVTVYRQTTRGWRLSSVEEAGDSRSQPYWASAVACVEARLAP